MTYENVMLDLCTCFVTGVGCRDQDAVRADYEAGRDMFDVVDEIAAEYED